MNKLKDLPTRLLISLLSALSYLSWKNIYRLSNVVSYLVFDLLKYRQEVVLTNLRNSFPDKSEEEIRQIASLYYRNVTDILLETVKLKRITRSEALERLESDSDILDKYYEEGKNLVIVLGHLGNWEIANLFASLRFSHQIVVVYHPLANTVFEDWLYKIRTQFGSKLVPMKEAYAWANSKPDKPFIFLLVNDQSPRPEKAYWTTFMNQDTGVFRGVEIISRELKTPVLYAGILRNEQKRGFYKFHLEVITENPEKEPNNSILERQITLLEKDIQQQPDNWLWSHRRWKHRRPKRLLPEQTLESATLS